MALAWQRLLAVLALAQVLSGGTGVLAAPRPNRPPWEPLPIGQPAPSFQLVDGLGDRWALHAIPGEETWVSFGSGGCPWCERQLPFMRQAALAHLRDLVVVQVDEAQRPSEAEAWQDSLGSRLPSSFHLLIDPERSVAKRYHVKAYPTSFFINDQGRIAGIYLGAMTSRAQLGVYLARALQQPRPLHPGKTKRHQIDDRGDG